MNLMVVVMFEVYQYKIVHLIIGIGSNYIWGVGGGGAEIGIGRAHV